MAYFRDAQDVYDNIGRLFQELANDEELAPKLRAADTTVQYRYHEPESQITVRLNETDPLQVDLGETELEPEVVLTMNADVAHRFWLGEVNATMAIARGQIRTKGPLAKVLKLAPVVKPISIRYRAALEAAGRADLLDV